MTCRRVGGLGSAVAWSWLVVASWFVGWLLACLVSLYGFRGFQFGSTVAAGRTAACAATWCCAPPQPAPARRAAPGEARCSWRTRAKTRSASESIARWARPGPKAVAQGVGQAKCWNGFGFGFGFKCAGFLEGAGAEIVFRANSLSPQKKGG